MEEDKPVPAPFDRLTPRELAVVVRIVEGDRNAQIAKALGCATKTVDTHRSAALKKLNLRHNVDLTREAIRVGLISLPMTELWLIRHVPSDTFLGADLEWYVHASAASPATRNEVVDRLRRGEAEGKACAPPYQLVRCALTYETINASPVPA